MKCLVKYFDTFYKNGKKYVRVKAKTCFYDDNELLEKFITYMGKKCDEEYMRKNEW